MGEEAAPPRHRTGDALFPQALLQQLQLPPGAAAHRKVGEGAGGLPAGGHHVHAAHLAADLPGHENSLGQGAVRRDQPHRAAGAGDAVNAPGAAAVLLNDRQCAAENLRPGAVVRRQADGAYLGPVLRQALPAGPVPAPEAVDGLVRVTDDKQALPRPVPGPQQAVLDGVAVLELVHQQVGEGPQILVRRSLRPGQLCEQQVVEVHGSPLLQQGLVCLTGRPLCLAQCLGQAVFLHGHRLEQPLGGHGLSRRHLCQGQALGLVQQAHAGLVFQADGVEGAHRQATQGPLTPQYMLQPLPELLRRPVGEGDRRNVPGAHPAVLNQMGDTVSQCAGLSGARSGGHRHRPSICLHGGPLGLIEPGSGGCVPLQPLPRRLFHRQGLALLHLLFGGSSSAEQAHLPAEGLPLGVGQQADFAVHPVVARRPLHLPAAQAADALGHAGPGGMLNVLHRRVPQDVELGTQPGDHVPIEGGVLFALRAASQRGGDNLRQGHQALEVLRPLGAEALRPIGQLLHPVEHPHGQLLPAHRAPPSCRHRLYRRQALAAGPVAVQVVLPLFGEKLQGTQQALAGAQGPAEAVVIGVDVKQIRFTAQFGGRVGVRVGHQLVAVQGGEPPVHGRVGGQAGLQGVDLPGQVPKAVLQAVKAGKGP